MSWINTNPAIEIISWQTHNSSRLITEKSLWIPSSRFTSSFATICDRSILMSSKSWTIKSINFAVILQACLLDNPYSSVTGPNSVRAMTMSKEVSSKTCLNPISCLLAFLFSTSMQCRFNSHWSIRKQSANTETKKALDPKIYSFQLLRRRKPLLLRKLQNQNNWSYSFQHFYALLSWLNQQIWSPM